MVIHVPALRHRREDLKPLVSHILARLSFELGIPSPPVSPEVLARFAESLGRATSGNWRTGSSA